MTSLALGIGVNSAVFTLTNAVLLLIIGFFRLALHPRGEYFVAPLSAE
jgi:hypothetical protein